MVLARHILVIAQVCVARVGRDDAVAVTDFDLRDGVTLAVDMRNDALGVRVLLRVTGVPAIRCGTAMISRDGPDLREDAVLVRVLVLVLEPGLEPEASFRIESTPLRVLDGVV